MTCGHCQTIGDWSGVRKREHSPTQISYCYRHLIVFYHSYLYIYNSTVRVFVSELLLNGSTDFDEIFCMRLGDAPHCLDSQIIPLGPTSGCAQTEIYKFTVEIFVYKWLPWVLKLL